VSITPTPKSSPQRKPTTAEARTITSRDAEWFTRTILGDDPWSVPCQVMRAINKPGARVAVKACHASAKTWTAARIVLWWTANGGIAITTAPTWTQVKRVLWGEIHQAYRGARFPLGGELNQTELRMGPNAYAIGLSTNEGVNFQGFHGRVLIVEDEAPGIRPDIVEAIEGIRAGGDVRILALGNPVIASGPFYDAFTMERSGWYCITVDAFDTPNLRGVTVADLAAITEEDDPFLAYAPRPYLTTRRWVWERLREWGEESAQWQSRVRGQFPDQSEDSLISLRWLEDGKNSDAEPNDDDPWCAGVDVAGPGDDETVLTVRHGSRVVLHRWWSQADPRGEVLAALAPYKEKNITVNVDTIGIGYNFALHIADSGYAVNHINVGSAPQDKEKYANAKAEFYWGLRERFAKGDVVGIEDETTIGQLAGIRYKPTARGQTAIESKEEARKRGVKSPDRAEAVMLAFATPPQNTITFYLPD
jgi:phage terminase large subunit